MNGDDDITVINPDDMDNLDYPVSVTDDTINSTLQLYIGTGKSDTSDAASLHALRNAYHDLRLRYNEQTSKVNSMKQAIKDMEALRIQNGIRPYNLNAGAALAEAAGPGSQTSGTVDSNPHLRANLGYAESLQRQIFRFKNNSAMREKDMEKKYTDLYSKYKRLEADVTTLQFRNRKTTAELEKCMNSLKVKDECIEQLTDRCKVLETKVGKQTPEMFSEESRLQEKQVVGIMDIQTQFIHELKQKIQEQNSMICKQLDMIRTVAESQKDAASIRHSDMPLRPDGDSLVPYHVAEQQRTHQPGRTEEIMPMFGAHGHPVQNTEGNPKMEGRQYVSPRVPFTLRGESLADVEAQRQTEVMVTNLADSHVPRFQGDAPQQDQLTIPQQVPLDTPDSPVMRRAAHAFPTDNPYALTRYLDPEERQSRVRLDDASVLQYTLDQPGAGVARQDPTYRNEQRLQAMKIGDKKLHFNDTIYRELEGQDRTGVLYPPKLPTQENNYENINVYRPPTELESEMDYVNVSELIERRDEVTSLSDRQIGSESQKCPVCSKNFSTKAIDKFQQHVLECMEDDHMTMVQQPSPPPNNSTRECPMCSAVFPGVLLQEEFERHVQEHFGEGPVGERFEVLRP